MKTFSFSQFNYTRYLYQKTSDCYAVYAHYIQFDCFRAEIDKVLNFFKVDLIITSNFTGNVNVSKSVTDLQKEVNEDITAKTDSVFAFVGYLKRFLSLSLLIVVVQSIWYLRNYLAKDGYDNIYITSQFKLLDQNNVKSGLPSVLPLKKKEKEKYVDARSCKLGQSELVHIKLSFFLILMHFVLCFLILLFDVALFYILQLIRQNGSVELSAQGTGEAKIAVKGQGPVADFYRLIIRDLSISNNYTATVEIGGCLPNAHSPYFGMYAVYILLYILVVVLALLQGYGLRLRREISAFYYPEQEAARLDYMHKKIRHKRVGLLKFLRQQVLSSHKEAQVKYQLRLSTWLMFKFPFLSKFFSTGNRDECLSCEHQESSFSNVKVRRCSGKSGGQQCEAVYCDTCWNNLKDECLLCYTDDVVLRH